LSVKLGQASTSQETTQRVVETEGPLRMTLVIAAREPRADLVSRVQGLQQSTTAFATEVVIVCESPWPEAPPGTRVIVTGPVSRGDKLDRACDETHGDLIAFLDEGVRLTDGWLERAIRLMEDPTVGAAGGPQLLPPNASVSQRAAWLVLSSRLGSGSLSSRFRRHSSYSVLDLPTTNLVVRRSAFVAVGGFQCPSPMGEDARLCYKLRSLLGLRILYDPELTVEGAPPPLTAPLLSLLVQWGQKRGDLTRRLPETSRRIPYPLPALALSTFILFAAVAPFSVIGRLGVLAVAVAYGLAGVSLIVRSRHLRAGLLGALGLPLAHLAYAGGFIRGYLGRSLGEIMPRRLRTRPLRILILNWRDVTHPWSGGAESYMHELARRWVRAGCEVGWVSERYRTGKRLEVIDGIRFHRVGGQLTLYALAALTYLVRLRNRYDVIIDCENGVPFFSPLYSRKPVILVVFHLHQEVFRSELPAHLRWLALWLEGWLMPRVYRRNTVVAISPSTSADLAAHGYDARKTLIVTSGVEIPSEPFSTERTGVPLLLYLGRLKRYKRVDVLIRAMARVHSEFPDARLAIVGQGPEREALERLAWKLGLAEAVRFYGYMPVASRDKLLSAAHMVVCPSMFEGWGVVCLEANVRGTPVVASDVPGLRDAVIDGVTGVLVPYGDSERLAKELIELIPDSERRERLGRAAFEWAASHSWDVSSGLFLQKILETAKYQEKLAKAAQHAVSG
jgi:glycosyltransferase involved in cell wall biosynthesis